MGDKSPSEGDTFKYLVSSNARFKLCFARNHGGSDLFSTPPWSALSKDQLSGGGTLVFRELSKQQDLIKGACKSPLFDWKEMR